MERNKIIIIPFFLFILFEKTLSQGLFVSYNHKVYAFLERMQTIGIIENYSEAKKPLLRSTITKFISEIFDKRYMLNEFDRKYLNYLINEFYFDLTGKLTNYELLFDGNEFNLFNDKEKFIYAFSDKDDFSIFIKSHLNFSSTFMEESRTAHFIEAGGRFYGSVLNHLGFELDGTNGLVYGSKSTALNLRELSYNFKLNEKPESKFFDRSYGNITIEFPLVNFGIGKYRQTIGYGLNKLIIGDFSPEFEKINLSLNYKSFEFDFTHGWLQQSTNQNDSIFAHKFFAHHRISFSPVKNIRLGIGESIIYVRSSPELSYLNPFNFYKSVEHQLQDQDNAILYFDLECHLLKRMRIYSSFLIDDIDFSKIGTGWFGNKTAFNIGTNIFYPISTLPLHFQLEFTRIEPYTFTHKNNKINYTNFDFPLGTEQPPNSYRIDFGIRFDPDPKLTLNSKYSFTKWGRNTKEFNEIINVGGDLNLGKRESDSDYVKFLDGEIETINNLQLILNYEFLRNITFSTTLHYSKFGSRSSFLILTFGLISFL